MTVEFGELLLMFIRGEQVKLLTKVFITDLLPEYHLYSLRNRSERVECLKFEDLPDPLLPIDILHDAG